MSPLRLFPTCHLSLCLTLALSSAFAPSLALAQQAATTPAPPAAADARPADLTYVVPSAVVVVMARPAQLLKSSAAQMFPVEVLQAAAIKEIGLNPLAAEEIVVSMSPPIAGPPSYTLLATFNEDISLKPSKMTEHTEGAELAGKKYLKNATPDPMAPSFLQPTGKQLLIGNDATLTQMIESIEIAEKLAKEKGDSGGGGLLPLVQFAKAASHGDDLLVMVDTATLRPFINIGLAQAQLPPELASLRQIPNLVKLIELRLNFSQPGNTELVLTANDKADAAKIVEVYDAARQSISDKVDEQARQALASDDPVEQAAGRYSQRMQKLWNSQLRLTVEDDRVVLFRTDLSKSQDNQMVYVATIGILTALLLPAVQAAREAARRNQSMNNMKQLMLSLLNYEAAERTYPAYANFNADGKPLLSWRVHILPFLEQQALYQQFHLDEPWDSDHNKKLIAKMPAVFLNPGSNLALGDGKTSYLGVKGEDSLFDGSEKGRSMRELTDGTSNSIALVAVDDDAAVIWTKPADWEPDAADLMKPFDGPHPGGFLTAFCDGSVRFMSKTIDPTLFKSLLTVDGGEVVARP
jgi:type II secretory pathway pseudopilin PulG